MEHYNLSQIKASFEQKKEWEKQFPVNYHLVRPLSFYLTYIVLKITRNPAGVALFGFGLGVIGCMFLAFPFGWSIWLGLFMIAAYSISDAIDGNIARTTDNVTLFGKYLDGLFGDIIDASYFFCLGIGMYLANGKDIGRLNLKLLQGHGQMIPFLCGTIILVSKLWSKEFAARYTIYRYQKEGLRPIGGAELKKTIGKSTISKKWYYLVHTNLDCLNNQILLLILLLSVQKEIWFLIFYSLYYSGSALLYFGVYLKKSRSTLK